MHKNIDNKYYYSSILLNIVSHVNVVPKKEYNICSKDFLLLVEVIYTKSPTLLQKRINTSIK